MDQTGIHPTGALLVQEICKTMSDLKLVKEWVEKSPKNLFTYTDMSHRYYERGIYVCICQKTGISYQKFEDVDFNH